METQDWPWKRGDKPGAVVVTITADGDPVDLTGSSFLAQVRKTPSSDVLATLTVDTTDAATGVVRVEPTAANTEAVYAVTRSAVWDLQWTDSGGTTLTPVGGAVLVASDVSRVEA